MGKKHSLWGAKGLGDKESSIAEVGVNFRERLTYLKDDQDNTPVSYSYPFLEGSAPIIPIGVPVKTSRVSYPGVPFDTRVRVSNSPAQDSQRQPPSSIHIYQRANKIGKAADCVLRPPGIKVRRKSRLEHTHLSTYLFRRLALRNENR